MELNEILRLLKDEHGIDVAALQAAAEGKGPSGDEIVSALAGVLRESGAVTLSAPTDEEITLKDVAEAVLEVAQEKVELSNRVGVLETVAEEGAQAKAEGEIDSLIREGRILPFQRDAMVTLSRKDRESFEALLPEKGLVTLSESGVTVHEQSVDPEKMQAEIDRLHGVLEQDSNVTKK